MIQAIVVTFKCSNVLFVSCAQVTLCSNTVRIYRVAVVVDIEGVGNHIRTLPINARSDKFVVKSMKY